MFFSINVVRTIIGALLVYLLYALFRVHVVYDLSYGEIAVSDIIGIVLLVGLHTVLWNNRS